MDLRTECIVEGKKGCVFAFRLRLDSDCTTKKACAISRGKQDEMKQRSLCWFVFLLPRLVHNIYSININGWAHAGKEPHRANVAQLSRKTEDEAVPWCPVSCELEGGWGVDRLWCETVWAWRRQRADSAPRMDDGLCEWLCVAEELHGPVDPFITLLWPNKTNLSRFIQVKVT